MLWLVPAPRLFEAPAFGYTADSFAEPVTYGSSGQRLRFHGGAIVPGLRSRSGFFEGLRLYISRMFPSGAPKNGFRAAPALKLFPELLAFGIKAEQ